MIGFVYRWDHKYNQHLIYVGSTKNDKEREREHRSDCHNPNIKAYSKPFYEYVRKYGTIDDWTMTVIYKGPKFRLFEKNYIKSTWLYNLNDKIPLRTEQEKKDIKKAYYKSDKIKEKYQFIKDKKNEQRREKVTCDNCGKIVNRNSLSVHKKTKKCMAFK